jgi:hypothetical protein
MRIGRKTRVALATGAALAVIGAGAVDLVYASQVGVEVEQVDNGLHPRCRGVDELGNAVLVPQGSRESLGGKVFVCVDAGWIPEDTGQ